MNELDIAYNYLKEVNKAEASFNDIWKYVTKECGLSSEEAALRIGQFYTNLQLDGRFVTIGENVWDLRERQTFDKVHIDMRDVYNDVETTDEEDLEDEEEQAYNAVYEQSDSYKEENDSYEESETGEEDSEGEDHDDGDESKDDANRIDDYD